MGHAVVSVRLRALSAVVKRPWQTATKRTYRLDARHVGKASVPGRQAVMAETVGKPFPPSCVYFQRLLIRSFCVCARRFPIAAGPVLTGIGKCKTKKTVRGSAGIIMSRDEAPKTDLLLRRRREQKRQEAQERRDQIRKPMLWVAIAILFSFGCCCCPVWGWIWEYWLYLVG